MTCKNKENLYGVLYSNGIFKVGRSSQVINRIKTHVRRGVSMGSPVSCCFISQPVDNPKTMEQVLIDNASKVLTRITREFFSEASMESAGEIMASLGLLVTWTDGMIINKKDGNPLVSCPIDLHLSDSKYVMTLAKSKLVSLIKENPFITAGVLNKSMEREGIDKGHTNLLLRELLEDRKIKEFTSIHPKNKTTIYKYSAIDPV